jgi:hypothetical protein
VRLGKVTSDSKFSAEGVAETSTLGVALGSVETSTLGVTLSVVDGERLGFAPAVPPQAQRESVKHRQRVRVKNFFIKTPRDTFLFLIISQRKSNVNCRD